MKPVLKVVIAEPSLIIRKGLLTVLKKLSTLNIEAAEVADMQQLPALLSWRRPDIDYRSGIGRYIVYYTI